MCKALEIKDASDTVRRALRPSEFTQVSPNIVSTDIAPRGGRDPLVVTESGLFGLIMTSRKPKSSAGDLRNAKGAGLA